MEQYVRTSKTVRKQSALSGILSAVTIAFLIAPVTIAHAHSVNDSILKIERVEQRVKIIDTLLDNAAKSMVTQNSKDVLEAEQLLRPIVAKAFSSDSVMKDLRNALGQDDADGDRLYATAIRLEDSRKQVDEILQEKDNVKLQKLEAKLKEKQAQLDDLANLMAGQDLAADTAFLGEAIRLTLQSGFPDNRSALSNKLPEDLKRAAVEGLEKLHSEGVDQGAFDQRVARRTERMGTVFALANVSDSDLKTLSDFYKSDQGKDKTKALAAKFDEIYLTASKEIMSDFWQKISNQSKNDGLKK